MGKLENVNKAGLDKEKRKKKKEKRKKKKD